MYMTIKRAPLYTGPKQRGDDEVGRAISYWAKEAQWPWWFAKNVVLWRKSQGLWWKTCGTAKEIAHGS